MALKFRFFNNWRIRKEKVSPLHYGEGCQVLNISHRETSTVDRFEFIVSTENQRSVSLHFQYVEKYNHPTLRWDLST